MLNRLVPAIAALAMATGIAPAMDQTSTTPSTTSSSTAISAKDREFVTQAAYGGLFEVESSRLAMTKGLDPERERIAQMILTDHQQANQQLRDIAKRKGLTVPQQLDGKWEKRLDALKEADDKDFSQQYVAAQKEAHQESIKLFERASTDAQDPDIRQFARTTLPTLQLHAQHLRGVEKGTQSGMSGSQGGMGERDEQGEDRTKPFPDEQQPDPVLRHQRGSGSIWEDESDR